MVYQTASQITLQITLKLPHNELRIVKNAGRVQKYCVTFLLNFNAFSYSTFIGKLSATTANM